MEKSALVYITLTIVVVLLGLFVNNKCYIKEPGANVRRYGQPARMDRGKARNLVAEFAVFCLLTGVSACRIAVGNDYWPYRDNFKLIAQERHVSYETGFRLIVKWMQELFGYDHYLPIFALFSIMTVFFFVKALHDQASDYAFSLFLLMTGGYYFNSLNSVRYYLALAMALYAMKYVLQREYAKFVLWILAGTMFHKSILLVIPAYLVAYLLAARPMKKWHYTLGGVFVLSLICGQKFYREIIFYFYPFYRNSGFDNGQTSYANIAKCVAVLLLGVLFAGRSLKTDVRNRFYFFLNLMGLAVYCCGSFIPEVSRVGYYLIVAQIFLLPRLLADMEKGWLRRLCYVGVIGAFAAYFVLLLRGMYDVNVRLLPYLNWIFN